MPKLYISCHQCQIVSIYDLIIDLNSMTFKNQKPIFSLFAEWSVNSILAINFSDRNQRLERSSSSGKSSRSSPSNALSACQRSASQSGNTVWKIIVDVTPSTSRTSDQNREYIFSKNDWKYTNGKSAL